MLRSALLLAALLLATVLPAAAGARTSVSNPPAGLMEGEKLTITDTAKQGKRTVRYYLSTDRRHDLGDPRLIGHRSARRARGKTTVRVPYTVPGDPMFLLACTGESCAASA